MILFFIRRFNDIDHITPIVYRMVKDGYKQMAVLALNSKIDLENDFRLNFLKNECGVQIDHVCRFYAPRAIQKFAARFLCRPANSKKQNIFIKAIRFFWYKYCHSFWLKKVVFKYIFGEKWAYGFLKDNDVRLLVFDWQWVKKPTICALIYAAKKSNTPAIAVPHGISLYTNTKWTVSSFNQDTELAFKERLKDYDKVLVQHERYKQTIVNHGVPKDKVHVLGSTRFCREWEEIYWQLIPDSPEYPAGSENGRVKVVFMDHSQNYRIDSDKVIDTVKKLSRLDFVDLVIKPSTASEKSLSSLELYNLARVDTDTSSVQLIRWADVVMGTTSSILLEPLLMDKIFVYPRYLHENDMLWDEMEACWTVKNYDELESALKKISEKPGYKPYSNDNVNNFIDEVVYGGVKDRDVLGDYKDFILSLI
ncbi:MAG: hypothetical protein FVQ85_04050 [Planctomycetes bacterium]|nr:hypothetical protein [Planctomycetota bacterium]